MSCDKCPLDPCKLTGDECAAFWNLIEVFQELTNMREGDEYVRPCKETTEAGTARARANESQKMDFEQTKQLYMILQGEIPEGFTLNETPKLSKDAAFSVIYLLQEHFSIIPDYFEQCERCKQIFDMEWEGDHFEDPGVNLCDTCIDIIYQEENGAKTHEDAVKEWDARHCHRRTDAHE